MASAGMVTVVVVLSVTTVALAVALGVIVYGNSTSEPEIDLSIYLRTEEEQAEVYRQTLERWEQPKAIRETVETTTPCVDNCNSTRQCLLKRSATTATTLSTPSFEKGAQGPITSQGHNLTEEPPIPSRKKRQIFIPANNINTCCRSSPFYLDPDVTTNIYGESVRVYHEELRRQYFLNIECIKASSCSDCNCLRRQIPASAVVHKDAGGLKIDLIYVLGCCNCFH